MKNFLFALGALAAIVALVFVVRIDQRIVEIGPIFLTATKLPKLCKKTDDCVVDVELSMDLSSPTVCNYKVDEVVLAPAKGKSLTWKLASKGGATFRFDAIAENAIDISGNDDGAGGKHFKYVEGGTPTEHKRNVDTKGDAKSFKYTIRVDTNASGSWVPCDPKDPVIISRD